MNESDQTKKETCGTCGFYHEDNPKNPCSKSEGCDMSANSPACEDWSERMIFSKDWEEFRKTGLLWFVNRILHMFGWALVVQMEKDGGPITAAYPARCKFRGFDADTEGKGFEKVARFMRDHGKELYDEADYDEANDSGESS